MAKTAFIDFKAVKSALTMEQVLGHYGILDDFKRSGDNLSGPCPIHKGNNPTQFRISISKNIWNCFSECKHGGNVLDFICRMEGCTVHSAALKAIEWFDLNLDDVAPEDREEVPALRESAKHPRTSNSTRQRNEPAREPEKDKPNSPLKFRLDKLQRDHAYLAERGLTLETVVDFGVGFCAKGMMAGRIAIPIHTAEGAVVAYAGRWPGDSGEDTPKYKLPPGFRKSQELFNIDRAIKEPPDKPLIIVEGFFDCMKLWQNGYKRVVALMGSTLCPAQEELIRKHTTQHSQIILMFDEDEAGRAGREDAAVRLSRCAFVRIHTFSQEGHQPENLTTEELATLIA